MTNLSEKKLVAARFDTMVTNSVYSSMLGLIQKYIQGLFPPEYFKDIYIRNSAANVIESGKTDDEKQVRTRPTLVLGINYQPLDASFNGDPFLLGNMLVRRDAAGLRNTYTRILWDNIDKIYVAALTSRTKNSFDVNIVLNTAMQAVNLHGFLNGRLGLNRPFFLNNKPIEVPLPAQLIFTIAAAKGYNLAKKEDVDKFNDLLKVIGDGNLTYKLHASSGKYLYFYRYRTNLMVKVTNYDTIESNREGKTEISSNVKFNIEVEFGNHVNFIMESYQNLVPPADSSFVITDDGLGAIMHWTLDMPVSEELENRQKNIMNLDLVTDVNAVLDETEFKEQLNRSVYLYIEHLKDTEVDISTKITSFVYKGIKKLVEGEDYTIDWKTYTLKMNNPFINSDYRFFMYAWINEINEFHDKKQ